MSSGSTRSFFAATIWYNGQLDAIPFIGLGRDEACNNRDLVGRLVAGCQSLLFLFGRFWRLASLRAACAPHLYQKIGVAVTMEDQLGFGWRCVYRRGCSSTITLPPALATRKTERVLLREEKAF